VEQDLHQVGLFQLTKQFSLFLLNQGSASGSATADESSRLVQLPIPKSFRSRKAANGDIVISFPDLNRHSLARKIQF
jgi:hypothetical protein